MLFQYLLIMYLSFSSDILCCFCFIYQKAMCYVSLELPALKLKQDSTMIAHKSAMFCIFKDAG